MHRRIICIASSLAPLLQQSIDAGDVACQLVSEMVSLSVLKHVFGIEKLVIDVAGGQVPSANHKYLSRSETRCFGLSSLNLLEELFENPHQGLEIS